MIPFGWQISGPLLITHTAFLWSVSADDCSTIFLGINAQNAVYGVIFTAFSEVASPMTETRRSLMPEATTENYFTRNVIFIRTRHSET